MILFRQYHWHTAIVTSLGHFRPLQTVHVWQILSSLPFQLEVQEEQVLPCDIPRLPLAALMHQDGRFWVAPVLPMDNCHGQQRGIGHRATIRMPPSPHLGCPPVAALLLGHLKTVPGHPWAASPAAMGPRLPLSCP